MIRVIYEVDGWNRVMDIPKRDFKVTAGYIQGRIISTRELWFSQKLNKWI